MRPALAVQFGLVGGGEISDDTSMRTLPSILLACAISLSNSAGQTRDEMVRNDLADLKNDPIWTYNDLDAGLAEAQKTGKPLFVVLRCIP